jgi:hypothetical protein
MLSDFAGVRSNDGSGTRAVPYTAGMESPGSREQGPVGGPRGFEHSPRQAAQRALMGRLGMPVRQFYATMVSGKNNASFSVKKGDLGSGSNTNEGTRNFVNDVKTPVPSTVSWSYSSGTDSDSGTVDNDSSNKSSGRWDAGHLLGRQNGGRGDLDDWVFPQNPQVNRGNSDDYGNPTYEEWRKPENNFKEAVNKNGSGTWNVSLS